MEREIKIDPNKTIMSKTDKKGIIEYANDYFIEVCGYDESELMGEPHNIIRHPDMPKVIFKELWRRLKKGENIHAIVKNRAKDGRYYWVLTSFETKYDDNGEVFSHYSRRKAVTSYAVYQIEKLYKTLRDIEYRSNMQVAERYFEGMLEDMKMSYDEYIQGLLKMNDKEIFSYIMSGGNVNEKKKKKSKTGRFFFRKS